MRRTRLLLVGDHGIVVQALRTLIQWNYDVVGTASDGLELIEAARRFRPDVIVADIDMPGGSLLEALRQVKTVERIDAKIVFLTMHGDPELAEEAFRAGGAGYVLKHSATAELHTAIQEVLQGRSYLTSHITNGLFAALASSGERPAALTARQRDVLRLTAQGRRMTDIAAILDLPTHTVEAEKDEMMDELALESHAELARYAIKHGFAVH
jgi:DNA-binding NarL/FixJ family response regulator